MAKFGRLMALLLEDGVVAAGPDPRAGAGAAEASLELAHAPAYVEAVLSQSLDAAGGASHRPADHAPRSRGARARPTAARC